MARLYRVLAARPGSTNRCVLLCNRRSDRYARTGESAADSTYPCHGRYTPGLQYREAAGYGPVFVTDPSPDTWSNGDAHAIRNSDRGTDAEAGSHGHTGVTTLRRSHSSAVSVAGFHADTSPHEHADS